ncbi:hypothetical protein D3C86_1728370 [compost metagenome]
MCRVHLKVIGVGILLEQLQLPGCQLVGVLIGIGRRNPQTWFFIGERVGPVAVAGHQAGRHFQTTVVRRNSACRVARYNRTKGRELAAQVGGGSALIGHGRPRQSDGQQAYRV